MYTQLLSWKKKTMGKTHHLCFKPQKKPGLTDYMKYGLSMVILTMVSYIFISGIHISETSSPNLMMSSEPTWKFNKIMSLKWIHQIPKSSWNGSGEVTVPCIQIYPDGKWLSICKSGTFLSDFYYYWMLQHNPSAKCGDGSKLGQLYPFSADLRRHWGSNHSEPSPFFPSHLPHRWGVLSVPWNHHQKTPLEN